MPWTPQEVRSKGCKFCGKKVYYNMAKHEWCDDPDLKIRHDDGPLWKPSNKAKEESIDYLVKKVDDILWQTSRNSSLLQELKLKLDSVLSERK